MSSCARKGTVDRDIVYNIQEYGQKNHSTYYSIEWTCHKNKEAEPVEPVQMNINQRNTCRKDLSWLHSAKT